MTFAVVYQYGDPEKAAPIRPLHRKYLGELKAAGKLVVAGPFRDFSGALIVYNAADEKGVDELIQADPFCINGVFQKWSIYPWNPVYSNHALIPEEPPA